MACVVRVCLQVRVFTWSIPPRQPTRRLAHAARAGTQPVTDVGGAEPADPRTSAPVVKMASPAGAHKRLSELIASPWRAMERFAEKAADFLVPESGGAAGVSGA